jgi:hypothetical protein
MRALWSVARSVALSVVALGLGAGCSDAALNTCTVDLQLQIDIGTGTVTDCGTFDIGSDNYTDQAMLAAQGCVINAIAANQTFRLSYDAQTIDGILQPGHRAGWDGIGVLIPDVPPDFAGTDMGPPTMTLRSYAGRGGGDMSSSDDLVSVQPCDHIAPTENCTPTVGVPCLSCIKSPTTAVSTVSCHG